MQIIVGLLLVGIALGVAAWAFYQVRRARSQFAWNQEAATVKSATLELGKGFYANIEYEYLREGRRILSNQLQTLEVSLPWPASAQQMIEKYPVGSEITVYVDPCDPSSAVIEPGGDPKYLPLFLTIAGFTLFVGVRVIFAAS